MAEKAAEDLAVDAAAHAALIGALRRQQQQEEEALATAASLQASDGQSHSAAAVAGVGVARLTEVEAATPLPVLPVEMRLFAMQFSKQSWWRVYEN